MRFRQQENPQYFEERFQGPGIHYQNSDSLDALRLPHRDPRIFTLPPIPVHRTFPPGPGPANQIQDPENDVFLPDSSNSTLQIPKSSKLSRIASFFKFKSSNSVSSKASSNSSGINSSSTSSPPFTPDSSLSIYTNSLDSDSDGEVHFYQPIRTHDEELDELTSLPVYYNQRHSFRNRNNSLPTSTNQKPPLYYNTTPQLSTFSKRRHSIASSENSYANLENSAAGYLVPIQTRAQVPPPPNSIDNIYLNELPFNQIRDEEVVRVEVHTPTSSVAYSDMFSNSSASTTIPQNHPNTQLRQCTSSDSSSTIEAILSPSCTQESKVKWEFGNLAAAAVAAPECKVYCKFCALAKSTVQNTRSNKMNIGILSSQDCFFSKRAESQLRKIFDTLVGYDRKKLNLAVKSFDMREMKDIGKATELHRSKIQIVIISFHFLDRLRHELNEEKSVSPINKILRPNRVIGILLNGVYGGPNQKSTKDEIVEAFQPYLLQFAEWETLELTPSSKLEPDFYKAFGEKVTRIYNTEQKPQSGFSLFPKKVTKFQPKVVLFFKNPLELKDRVNVELKKGSQKVHVQEVILVNPYSGIVHMPSSMFDEDHSSLIEIAVTVNERKLGAKVLKYDHNSQIVDDDVFIQEEEEVNPPSDANYKSENSLANSTLQSSEYYDLPRPTKQDYCIPPPARPVVPTKPKRIATTNQNQESGTSGSGSEVSNYTNLVSKN